MKREFLAELGLDKEAIDKIMAENGRDIEKQKALTAAAEADRDGHKAQLDEVAAKLKAFDGVDLDALRGEIDTLKADLAKKEADFQEQLSSRDFDALLTGAVAEAKGRNAKLIKAALDVDKLKTSKNQKDDISAALKALQESDAYLFETGKTEAATRAKVSTGGQHNEGGGSQTDTNALMNSALRGAVRGE